MDVLPSVISTLSDYALFLAAALIIGAWFAVRRFMARRRVEAGSGTDPLLTSEELIRRARAKAVKIVEETDTRAGDAVRDADKRAAEIISEADKKALTIVGEADRKAAEVVKVADATVAEMKGNLERSLKEVVEREGKRLTTVSDELLQLYRKSAESSQHAYAETLEVASNTITADAREGMLRFQKFLEDEMKRQQNLLSQFIQERRDSIQRDIEQYKNASMKKIDDSIYGILLTVSKEAIGKALDVEEHQELIVRALEDAKKENFFRL